MAISKHVVKFVILLVFISNVVSLKLTFGKKWARVSNALQSRKDCNFPLNPSHKQVVTDRVWSLSDKTRKQGIVNFSIAAFSAAAAIFANPMKSRGADLNLPECSDSITVLKSIDRQVYLIGTAHISEESALLVRKMIQTTEPNVVMIELDAKRLGRVSKESLKTAGFDIPFSSADALEAESRKQIETRQNIFSTVISGIASQIGNVAKTASGAILGTVLSQFYKSVEKLGFNPGGELKAAINEGKAVGARILLGDRDVDITLQHLSAAISNSDQDSFARVVEKVEEVESQAGLSIDDSMLQDKAKLATFVEAAKQRETLRILAATIKQELPLVYAALIGERDEFLASSIATSTAPVMVAVVGMMHMEGIEHYLTTKFGFAISKRNCPSIADAAEVNYLYIPHPFGQEIPIIS